MKPKMPTRFSWLGFPLTVSFSNGFSEGRQIAVVIFFMCRLCYLFSATTISFIICNTNFSMYRVRMKAISDLHHWLLGRCCQSKPHLVGFLCSVAWALPSFLACLPVVLMLQGLLFFNISTDVGRWVPRKWQIKGDLEGTGAGSAPVHFAITGGLRWRWSKDEEGFLFWPKNKMRTKYISYKSVLQKIVWCTC